MRCTTACVLSLGLGHAAATNARLEAGANPIRKVVDLLQAMKKQVTEEGKKEAEMFEAFMCYCKKGTGNLDASIEAATAKIESLAASLKAATEKNAQTKADLKEHSASRDEAKDTLAKAVALRKKEASVYAKFKAESETNIKALASATTAVEQGMKGSFLQTETAKRVRQFAMESAVLPDDTRDELLSFLSGGGSQGYAPASGEIVGILKTMHDEMTKGLNDATDVENDALKNYEELSAAKKKEISTLQAQIENEMKRAGNLDVKTAEMENDKEDTEQALTADQKFKAELKTNCATKSKEWETIQKVRSEELLAISETITVINDDDAMELFKKTLPSASMSLMQVDQTMSSMRARALAALGKAKSGRPGLDFISLALRGKKAGFTKVIGMIDEMVKNLAAEQKEDDSKKEYCDTQLDESEDKKKQLENSISDSDTSIAEMEGSIQELTDEIAALTAGVKALDNSVTEATALRKKENAAFKDLETSDTTAKEVLLWAKNRLNKFYNPTVYKPPPGREMSEEERITVNMGGSLEPVEAGGIAGTGIGASFAQVSSSASRAAPPPPPETAGAYQKKSGKGNGVIAMMDLLVADLDKELQEATVNEKDAQQEYETMMQDASDKRAADSKSITQKSEEKASTEEALQDEQDKRGETATELMNTEKVMSNLHGECDWLLKYFDVRKDARSGEVEALSNAKAVLSGADYSLIQSKSFLVRRHMQ